MALFTFRYSAALGTPVDSFHKFFDPGCCFASIALFVFFRWNVAPRQWKGGALRCVLPAARLSFGVYLVHDLLHHLHDVDA